MDRRTDANDEDGQLSMVVMTAWVGRKRLFADTPLPCDLSTLPWGRLIEGGAIWSTLDLRCVCKRTTLPMTARLRECDESRGTRYSERHVAQSDAGQGSGPQHGRNLAGWCLGPDAGVGKPSRLSR
jgi:hypothetical protein